MATCLLFAMWFASGAVMHFVPFPGLSESERTAGLVPLRHVSGSATSAALNVPPGTSKPDRARLQMVADRPVIITSGQDGGLTAHDARDGRPLQVDADLAIASAYAHARARGLSKDSPTQATKLMHDQWSVPNRFDRHRPLYRVQLSDTDETELYVSSVTGEVLLDTNRQERFWNWTGSVLHWIYPTVLRRDWILWDRMVWTLSLVALIGATAGAVLGAQRLGKLAGRYRGWMRWHHRLGITAGILVLTWIFSGWLSMDHGRVFSDGHPTASEHYAWSGGALVALPLPHAIVARSADGSAPELLREIEWFQIGQAPWARLVLSTVGNSGVAIGAAWTGQAPRLAPLLPEDLAEAARAFGSHCKPPYPIAPTDAYRPSPRDSSTAVLRTVCGPLWYHIDASDGRLIERLDASRRWYRWLYQALHTWDWPALADRPLLRTVLLMAGCGVGFGFSLTGVVLSIRRLRLIRRARQAGGTL